MGDEIADTVLQSGYIFTQKRHNTHVFSIEWAISLILIAFS
jgi:hypothetical protein